MLCRLFTKRLRIGNCLRTGEIASTLAKQVPAAGPSSLSLGKRLLFCRNCVWPQFDLSHECFSVAHVPLKLCTIMCLQLTNVSGSLVVDNNFQLASLSLPSLRYVGAKLVMGSSRPAVTACSQVRKAAAIVQ